MKKPLCQVWPGILEKCTCGAPEGIFLAKVDNGYTLECGVCSRVIECDTVEDAAKMWNWQEDIVKKEPSGVESAYDRHFEESSYCWRISNSVISGDSDKCPEWGGDKKELHYLKLQSEVLEKIKLALDKPYDNKSYVQWAKELREHFDERRSAQDGRCKRCAREASGE